MPQIKHHHWRGEDTNTHHAYEEEAYQKHDWLQHWFFCFQLKLSERAIHRSAIRDKRNRHFKNA